MKSVLPVEKVTDPKQGGGKACGLSFMKRAGKNIPETWVITVQDDDEISAFVGQLSDNVTFAIRSSAISEDGMEHSFAGQYKSFLNVRGQESIVKAIYDCFASAHSGTVESYKKDFHFENGNGMHVIVQEMIHPVTSGVLFTADPVAQRRDKIVLSVTPGLGEDLMSGHTAGENISFYKYAKDLPTCKYLDPDLFRKLVNEAIEIEERYKMPADLEWSIDKKGTLWWLQLRPVTSLDDVHLNEFDEKPGYSPPVYTRANIGEMMPGPVTPLTLSTFGKAIERATQQLYISSGAQKKPSDSFIYIHSFYNHLFMDVQALYEIPRHVWLSRKENVDYSVIGDIVEGIEVKRENPFPSAVLNFFRMLRFVNRGPEMSKRLRKLHGKFSIDCQDDVKKCYELIDKNIPILDRAYLLHYVTSSQSGSLFATILNILAKGKKPGREHQEKVAAMFTDIPGVESANVIHSIDELAEMLSLIPGVEEKFTDVPVDCAVSYLREEAPDGIRKFWDGFIERHGYRCVREAELRETEWAIDPGPVIEGVKAKARAILSGHNNRKNHAENAGRGVSIEGVGFTGKMVIKKILPKARASVARREQSKAHAIGIQYQFKKAYRHLAGLLVEQGYLEDADQIFFLMHEEIGEMIGSGDKESFRRKAEKRRKLYPEMQAMAFPDVTIGIPVPVERDEANGDGKLKGIPVSRGVVEGKVHLVRNLAEAGEVKKGEIMVVQYTDVGWTPFYGIIAGLITEIGSPLSHGAVVAREYGLPTVVSVKGALSSLRDGQHVRLDAIRGKVEILEEALLSSSSFPDEDGLD